MCGIRDLPGNSEGDQDKVHQCQEDLQKPVCQVGGG